jgi:hypothetical protein
MTKLEDIHIKTKDRALRELLSDIVSLWNGGKYSFKIISSEPTDTPDDGEIRIYDSGAGVVRLYVFAPGSGSGGVGWWRTANLTEVT